MSIKFEYDFGDGDEYQEIYYHEVDEEEVKQDLLEFIEKGKMPVSHLIDFIIEEDGLQKFIDAHYICVDLKRVYLAEARSDYRDLD